MDKLKKNWLTIIIVGATVVLGVIAVFTAVKLYQLGKEPEPKEPETYQQEGVSCPCSDDPDFDNFCLYGPSTASCPMTFPGGYCDPDGDGDFSDGDWELGWELYGLQCGEGEEVTVDPRCVLEFSLPTSTPTPTPTPIPECWDTCVDFTNHTDCPSSLRCMSVSNDYRCVNEECPEESDCLCPTPTPTRTPTPTPTRTPTPTPTRTPTPTPTPPPGATPTPTPTPVPGCWGTCTPSTGCTSNLSCQTVNGTYRCVNTSCPTETDCICPTYVAQVTATPVPQLPEAGFSLPTLGAVLTGLILLVTSLVLII